MSYWDAFLPGLALAALAIAVLPWVDRKNTAVRVCVLATCLVLAWHYMSWRITSTIPAISNPTDFVVGVIFTTVETLAMIGTTASLVFLMRVRNRSPEADRNVPWLLAQDSHPLVDVLICTYNEPEPILERTIVGALSMTYPNFRVWVCDDTRRPWLKALCEKHGCGYLTRPDNLHAKAGNINATLKHLAALDRTPDYISILDADFVPLPEFLTRTVSLTKEPGIGVVQTPQHFFNPDPIQHNLSLTSVWPDEQRFFFEVVMPAKDAWGGAFCCGTSSLIRFDALQSIGGFPTDSVTEDYLVTLRLKEKGFKTIYLNEPLSLGLAPEGLAEYSGQRSRWCLGFIQICRGPSGPFKVGNGLPLIDRIMLLETFLFWSATHAFRLLGMIVPVLYLLFDIQAVNAPVTEAIDHMFPFFVVQGILFAWITEGRVLPLIADVYQMLCAPEVLRAVWSGLLKPKGQKFKVTAKGGDRARIFIQWPMLKIFLGLIVFTMLGIAREFLYDDTQALAESSCIALFWSWYNLVVLTLACMVCIEQSQRRVDVRFPARKLVRIDFDGGAASYTSYDISVGGMGLIGTAPLSHGSAVNVAFDEIQLAARVVRIESGQFGIEFEPSFQNKVRMIRHIFSAEYSNSVKAIRPSHVAAAVASRLLR